MAVPVGELIPDSRIIGVEFAGLFKLWQRGLLLADIAQETRIGHTRAAMIGMAREEFLIRFFNNGQSIADTSLKRDRAAGALLRELLLAFDPLIDLSLRLVVRLH